MIAKIWTHLRKPSTLLEKRQRKPSREKHHASPQQEEKQEENQNQNWPFFLQQLIEKINQHPVMRELGHVLTFENDQILVRNKLGKIIRRQDAQSFYHKNRQFLREDHLPRGILLNIQG